MTARGFLLHNDVRLELNDGGKYSLLDSFRSPTVRESALVATGTSANRLRGGLFIDKKARNEFIVLPVTVKGDTGDEVHSNAYLLTEFLTRGTKDKPVFLGLYRNSNVPEPRWGQHNAARRYKIINVSDVQWGETYLNMGNIVTDYTATLEVAPYGLGIEQDVMFAKGGIFEDIVGSATYLSRGIVVPPAATNYFTNPVFGAATYTTGWTVGAGIINRQNTDRRFRGFGINSILLTPESSTAGGRSLLQSVTVPNTNTYMISCYAKRPDCGVVDSSTLLLGYSVNLNSTAFTHLGSGWYRLTAQVTGIAAATNAGVVDIQEAVYVDGFQIEEADIVSPVIFGDLPGCSWTGASHTTTSSRTAAETVIDADKVLADGHGTVRAVLFANTSRTDYLAGNDAYQIWGVDTAAIGLYFDAFLTNQFSFNYGLSQVGASTLFDAGDVIVVYCSYGESGITITVNSSSNTNVNLTRVAMTGDEFSVGTPVGGGSSVHPGFTIMGICTWDEELTSTQIMADYNNLSKAIENLERVEGIPYFWNDPGDDNVDPFDPDNYFILSGIDGNAEASIKYTTQNFGSTTGRRMMMNQIVDYIDFLHPGDVATSSPSATVRPQYYHDFQGTADANASRAEYLLVSIPASPSVGSVSSTIEYPFSRPNLLDGSINFICRLRHSGGAGDVTFRVTPVITLGGKTLTGTSQLLSIADSSGSDYSVYYLGRIDLDFPDIIDTAKQSFAVGVQIEDINSSGFDIHFDYLLVATGNFRIFDGALGTTSIITPTRIVNELSSDFEVPEVGGEVVNAFPQKYNYIWYIGAPLNTTGSLAQFENISVTPRYRIM